MDTLNLLQHYWWLLVSLLGALLVFLLFVQGGQGLIYRLGHDEPERERLVAALGHKWELTFTTLVTFGGAFFASFPLFYATSFGGAFLLWTAILFLFVLQAVAYEYRRKPANLLGMRMFDAFLQINGLLGPLLLGTVVSTLFTGAPFTVDRFNLAQTGGGGAVVIAQWTTPWYGLEALASSRNLALGFAVALLTRMLGCQYFMNALDDPTLVERARRRMLPAAVGFLLLFLYWFVRLLAADGPAVAEDGTIVPESGKYLHNLVRMPLVAGLLLAGVVLLLGSVLRGWRGRRDALWFGGGGTVLAVMALLLLAGWNDTAYYPSSSDMQSSLTIRNSSSGAFTLRVMSWVSLLIPVVVLYVRRVWRALR